MCLLDRNRPRTHLSTAKSARQPQLVLFVLLGWLFLTACTDNTQRYALATAHPLATKAGVQILEEGGNAFDAAITISAVLAVVEPYSSGFGGGGFWLLHRQSDNKQVMLDGRERAPGAARRKMYLDPRTEEPIPNQSLHGPLAAGIPGMPAALVHLAENYALLPLTATLQPALKYAREGFPADGRLISRLEQSREKLFASTQEVFLVGGRLPEPGQAIVQTNLANTIERIMTQGFAGFYNGTVAKNLVQQVKAHGGIWEIGDLAAYRVVERKPIQFYFQGASITSAALPSAGGMVLAEILNTLQNHPADFQNPGQRIHYLIESMRLAYRDRAQWMGDSDFVKVPTSRLLSSEYAKTLYQQIDPNHATVSKNLNQAPDTQGQDTTHFSVMDAQGNRVAATLSINYSLGSKFIAKGTGVLLNNEMDDFVIKSGTPNIYKLVGSEANMIEPNKRMLSSMSPTFIDDGQRIAILGTPGGSRIITMVLLAILNFLEGADAQSIVASKRFHHQHLPDRIEYETGAFSEDIQQQLIRMGHTLKQHESGYGNMHVVIWDKEKNQLSAASDPRGIGSAYVD